MARRRIEPDFVRTRQLNVLESHSRKAVETERDRPGQPAIGGERRPRTPSPGPGPDGTDQRRQHRPHAGCRRFQSPSRIPLQYLRHPGVNEGLCRSVPQMLGTARPAQEDGLLESLPDHRDRADSGSRSATSSPASTTASTRSSSPTTAWATAPSPPPSKKSANAWA